MAGNPEYISDACFYGTVMDPAQMEIKEEQPFSPNDQINPSVVNPPPPLRRAPPHCVQQSNCSDLCPSNAVNPNHVQHCTGNVPPYNHSQNFAMANTNSDSKETPKHKKKPPMLCGPNLMEVPRQFVPMEEVKTPDQDAAMFDFGGEMISPGEGYFSRENFIATTHQPRSNLSDTLNKLSSGPFSRLTHPRKSPPLKRYYRTPSPPRIHAQPPQQNNAIAECYYTGSVHPRSVSAMAMSDHMDTPLPPSHTIGNPNHCATAMLRSSTPNPTTSCAHSMGKNSITVKSNGITRTIAILNRNRPLHNSTNQQQPVIQPQPVKPCTGGCPGTCPHRAAAEGEHHDGKPERGKSMVK